MVFSLLLALSMTPQEKTNMRLCTAQKATINYVHNKNDGKSVVQICEWAMTANDNDVGELLVEDCYEYLKYCDTNK